MSRRYDSRTTTFTPDGRLQQIEYAVEAINKTGSAIGTSPPTQESSLAKGSSWPPKNIRRVSSSNRARFPKKYTPLINTFTALFPDSQLTPTTSLTSSASMHR